MLTVFDSPSDELAFRRRALKDALMCLAWLKLFSVTFYIALYFMILLNTKDDSMWAQALQAMVLITTVPAVLLGVLLIVAALTENAATINIALCISVVLAVYDIFLGITGTIYFVHTGRKTMHFFIAVCFVMLALSFFPVMGNDWFIMYSYKKLLNTPR